MATKMRFALLLFSGIFLALGSSQTVHKMAVRSDIRFRFATTEMICVMSNDADGAKELKFDVTLPKDAFIANFSMEIEGKLYPGSVKEKQKAKEQYEQARQSGHSGGLVEQSARHSNKFDVSVNIAAGSNVTFTLIYQELLRRRFGAYEHSIYINSKTLDHVQDYSIEVYIQDRNEIRDVRTPAMRKEITNNAVEERQNTLTQIINPSATTVYVVYRPSAQELKEQGSGWFVVQYDVNSDSVGDLLVVDGYFVHFFMPPDDLPPLPLDIVFVLDISGSMAGRKMEQLKDAMRIILDDLRETDRFNILLFDGSVQQWGQSLQEASESNVNRAQDYVRAITYRGSTNLHLALIRGLEMLQGSREVNRVPMIFFLTDGEATAGVQDSKQIVAEVSQKNEGVVNIYSLAFGSGADYKLLRQISAKNKGFARKIYEASDASEQVSGLYREISTIVIRGLNVTYHPTSNNDDGDNINVITVDNRTVTICTLPTLFAKSDFVVAGKLRNAETLMMAPEKAGGLKLAVSGLGAGQQINLVLEENNLAQLTLDGDNPFWTVPRDLSKMAERAWAFLMIKQLLEEKVAVQEEASLVRELDKKILDLSLKYHFVTPLTSMVVTRPEDNIKKNKTVAASFTDDDDVPASQDLSRPVASHSFRRQQHIKQSISSISAHRMVPASFPMSVLSSPGRRFASVPKRDSTNMSPGRPGPSSRRSWRKSKNRRLRKGKKRKTKKTCIRNKKVILQSLTAHGQETEAHCYDLKALRTPVHNYTLLLDKSANFSVTLSMKKRLITALYVTLNRSNVSAEVSAHGNLTFTHQRSAAPSAGLIVIAGHGGQRLEIKHDQYMVTVSVTKKACKATFLTVDINVGANDADAAVLRRYSGIVAKAFQGLRAGKSRASRTKKEKVSKACKARNFPADRSSVLKGKYLLRYRA